MVSNCAERKEKGWETSWSLGEAGTSPVSSSCWKKESGKFPFPGCGSWGCTALTPAGGSLKPPLLLEISLRLRASIAMELPWAVSLCLGSRGREGSKRDDSGVLNLRGKHSCSPRLCGWGTALNSTCSCSAFIILHLGKKLFWHTKQRRKDCQE